MVNIAELEAKFLKADQIAQAGGPDAEQAVKDARLFKSEILKFRAQQKKQRTRGSAFDPIQQGFTLGWSDELGGIGAYLGSRLAGASPDRASAAAQREIAEQRADLAAFRERNPMTAMGLEFASGMVPGVGAMRSATKLPAMIGAGAGSGAIAGAGAADENKLAGGLFGGAVGGVLTGALPAIAAGAGKLGGAIGRNVITPIRERITRDPAASSTRIMQEAFDGMSPSAVMSAQRQLGPMATPADIGGPQVLGLTQGAIQKSGPAMARARELTRRRKAGQAERLSSEVAQVTGNRPRMLEALDEINARQASASKDAYRKAYAVDIAPDDELVNLMNRPAIRDAIPQAIRGARNAGRELPSLEKIVMRGDDWQVSKEVFPDMRALDSMKQALDDMVTAAYRSGNPEARSIKIARNEFRDKLDEINPDYAAARNVYAGDAALKDAMESGEKMLNQSTRQVREVVRDLSDSEKEAYMTGAVEGIRERMGRARSGEMGAFNFLEKEGAKEKMRMLFPRGRAGDRQMAQLMRILRRERTFAENETALVGGSQTALRQAGGEILGGQAMMPTTLEAIQHPTTAGANALLSGAASALKRQPQQTIDRIGEVMLTPNNADEILRLMAERGSDPATYAQMVETLSRRMGALSPSVGLLGVNMAQQ